LVPAPYAIVIIDKITTSPECPAAARITRLGESLKPVRNLSVPPRLAC
jgi:hypothetical protein